MSDERETDTLCSAEGIQSSSPHTRKQAHWTFLVIDITRSVLHIATSANPPSARFEMLLHPPPTKPSQS